MKTTTLVLILFLTALASWAQPAPGPRHFPQRANLATNTPAASVMPQFPGAPPVGAPGMLPVPNTPPANVPSASDAPAAPAPAPAPAPAAPPEEMIPAGNINFQGVDVGQVLDVYAKLVGRTLLRAGLPSAQIVLRTETPLTKTEAVQALQAVLALNGIAVVNVGEKFVKVLPVDQANSAGAKMDQRDVSQLPEMGSYVTHIVQLKYTKPTEMIPIIQPFAKLANSILAIDGNGILVLRDNAENVKRMLEMIDQVDIAVPAEYISEVIPIRYALAEDIANALNTLGGSGGSTVSIGSTGASTPVSGIGRSTGVGGGGMGGQGGQGGGYNQGGQQRPFGGQTTPGAAPGGQSTFQQRLQSIIQKASAPGGQQDQIQVFGQTKIIADQRSNSLLIFATQADMERIKAVVAKLDVLLAQVLIESVIMDVSLNKGWNLGVSAEQNPSSISSSKRIASGGGFNNGQPFANFINNSASLAGTNVLSGLSSGFSYFGNIGPTWDVALQAAASDNTVSIIQRPRIQTSQAKAATFFVGNTVPYVNSVYYNSGVGSGASSSYSQLSVGVELDITPFINPDGLVVMDINQEIDDINGFTTIQGVGDVPNTDKRTLQSEIAVKDRDTVILGGFVRSQKSKNRSGVPLLQDIPILGALFSTRSDTKTRSELIVLMRPTVLRTPEIAAIQAIKEERRLPGISAFDAENTETERKQMEAERRAELKRAKLRGTADGPFNRVVPPDMPVNTNAVSPRNP